MFDWIEQLSTIIVMLAVLIQYYYEKWQHARLPRSKKTASETALKDHETVKTGVIVHELGRSIAFLVPFLTLFRSPYRSTWVADRRLKDF